MCADWNGCCRIYTSSRDQYSFLIWLWGVAVESAVVYQYRELANSVTYYAQVVCVLALSVLLSGMVEWHGPRWNVFHSTKTLPGIQVLPR